ncbi:hypothetical protein [Neisseria chenwenguii]|uniref:Uncharacterized protein n=1 Tax=Neisseria chenwenguii TaxID=1853278 RepID=A0A220S037_9NEIS|nr:hypothetical protein [Neisseria chenwenguii]ASK26726.1 hypothetical protein BG910_02270 [Neisseria chenwenguii]ROV56388.1 hypothetical protein EGS38_05075 [Neisseria chenwenguii]
MNANLKLIVPAVLAAVALSACGTIDKFKKKKDEPVAAAQTQAAPAQQQGPSAPQTVKVDSIDSTKEVAYKCGNEPLNVMYGIKGGEVVAAQVKFRNQLSPGLFRVASNTNGQNAFWGEGIAWIAEQANGANVDKVNGNMLTIRGTTTVNGKQQVVDQIAAKSCMLDKTATAKLNKGKAAPAAKSKKK